MIELNENEMYVILYALECLNEESEYYMAEHYTHPSWVKEKITDCLKEYNNEPN